MDNEGVTVSNETLLSLRESVNGYKYDLWVKEKSWELYSSLKKPSFLIVVAAVFMGILQLSQQKTIFGIISLLCGIAFIFMVNEGTKAYYLVNTNIEKIIFSSEGIVEQLRGNAGTKTYLPSQIRSIYADFQMNNRKLLGTVKLKDCFDVEHTIFAISSKKTEEVTSIVNQLVQAIADTVPFEYK